MNWLEFLSSLAWPSVVIFIFFFLKDSVSKRILGLSNLKYKDFELVFHEKMSTLEDKIEASYEEEIPPSVPTTVNDQSENNELKEKKIENNFISKAENYMYNYNKRAKLILEKSFDDLSDEVINLFNAAKANGWVGVEYNPYKNTIRTNIAILRDNQVISNDFAEILFELVEVLDSFFFSFFQFMDEKTAKEYEQLIQKAIKRLKVLKEALDLDSE
ncbi:hypothetical protein P9D79_21965 [Bacillus haynesii]|uniref:hypothetical protein n=1 Tax=Bacillus haynesii TaxID=1925021 RepID=UPI002282CD83|nr:hypothetical protein [Bacillus haynesii]MCY8144377.1 hypothetical protein [Bacillus haynesii]MEC1458170.1 hypothetical protein [Bacillus haynesii]MEC1575584.1 hypothetical protein [Bacillus haynesii]